MQIVKFLQLLNLLCYKFHCLLTKMIVFKNLKYEIKKVKFSKENLAKFCVVNFYFALAILRRINAI